MADALGTPGGVVSAVDHRLDQAGLIAPQSSTLAVRTGVMWGPGATAIVTGTAATGTMTYSIGLHHWVSTRGTADGVYLGTKEGTTTVATAAAPGANSRIDVIWSKQQDAGSTISADGSTGEQYGVTSGTAAVSPTKPTIPVGAEEIATAVVAAGATSTGGAGVTITNTARLTVARGAAIPVRNTTEREALTKFVGLTVKRLDDGGREERWTGTAWAGQHDVPVLASIAARNTYFSGNLRAGASALVAGNLHVYDGAAWRFDMQGTLTGITSAVDGLYTFNHNGGQVPRDWSASIPQQPSDAISLVLQLVEWGESSTTLTVRTRREDANAWFSTPFNIKWRATF